MTGTLINVATIILGTSVGVLLKSKLPKKLIETVFQSIGLFTLVLGIYMGLKMNNFLIVVFSLVIGAITGEGFDIESSIKNLSEKIKGKLKVGNEKFSEGVLTAFLLFCMGSMTILGAFDEGIKGDATLLITKSVLDGFASIALASALGIGVGFSVIPLLAYQGGLTLLAFYFGQFISENMMNELTAVGGILILGIGLNILEIKKIRVFNILPALVFVLVFTWVNDYFQIM